MLSDNILRKIKSLVDDDRILELRQFLADLDSDDISEGHLFGDQTIFMYACQYGTPEAVSCFMEKNVVFYEIKYSDKTEFKCAASNQKYSFEILCILLNRVDKATAKEVLESNGDPYFDLEGEGDGKTPADILKAKGDRKSLKLLQDYLG